MWVSGLSPDRLTDDVIDRLLFDGLEDRGEAGDCILVLGSNKAVQYRMPVALEAYRAGRAPRLLLSGGAADVTSQPEAEKMLAYALSQGVPREAVLLENQSANTVENMLCSLLVLQRSLWLNRVHSVLLTTTAFHMRRSLQIARYLFPEHIAIHPLPAQDQSTRRDNWMLSDKGRARATAEAQNIIRCVANGLFPDFEI